MRERTSGLFCSHCEMPVFPEEDKINWLFLDPFLGLVFCDLYCSREFMINLTNAEIESIQGIDP